MKKITSLTEEQKARIPEWVDKWIKIGLSTEEADWKTFEKSAIECYKFANLNTNIPIIRVQSPIVGALAAPIAANIICNILKNKDSAVDSAVSFSVNPAVNSAVYEAVNSVVNSVVKSAVYSAVNSAVYEAVESAVNPAVKSAVYEAVESAVNPAVNSVVNSAVDSAVDSAVYEADESAVNPAVKSAVYSAVNPAVNPAVYEAVDSAVYEAVYETVESAVNPAVYEAVNSAVRSNKNIFWHYWLGGKTWSAWQAYVTFFTDVCELELDLLPQLRAYENVQKSVDYWWPNKYFIMVCNRPEKINIRNNQLHCTDGPSIKWRDGYELYSLNGVTVPKEYVMTPAEQLDPNLVLKETNAEKRRELVRKIGIERVIQKLGAKVLDTLNEYQLLELPKIEGMQNNPRYLKMKNPSIGVWHVEGVTANCNTVKEALHFRKPKELQNIPVDDINGKDWYQQGDVCIWPKGAKSVKFFPSILT